MLEMRNSNDECKKEIMRQPHHKWIFLNFFWRIMRQGVVEENEGMILFEWQKDDLKRQKNLKLGDPLGLDNLCMLQGQI